MLKLPADTKLDTQYKRIGAYLNGLAGEDTLALEDYQVMKRWMTAHDLALSRKVPSEVVSLLMSTYQVSKRTAYNDIYYSRLIYATPAMPREVAQGFMESLGLELLEASREAGDMKAAKGFYTELMHLYGLRRPESESVKPADLTPQVHVHLTMPTDKPKKTKGEQHAIAEALLKELATGTEDDDITDLELDEDDQEGDNAQ